MKDKNGNRLYRHIEITIHFPKPLKSVEKKVKPGRSKAGFNAEAIDKIIMEQADHLEERFPMMEFRLASRGPNRFSFIFVEWRIKAPQVSEDQTEQVPKVAVDPLPKVDEQVADAQLTETGNLNPVG